MSFSVIKTGGKQYIAEAGKFITIELLKDVKVGDTYTFTDVLLTDSGSSTTVGTPTVAGSTVTGTVLEVGKAKKLTVIKYKAKSRYFKKRGHRQPFTKVMINSI